MGDDSIAAAYRLAIGELRRVVGAGEELALKERGAVRWNEGGAVGRASAEKVQAEVLASARELVARLALVHVSESRASATEIAEAIRKDFVDVGLQGLPGAGLYVSSRGFGSSASGARLRENAAAMFNARRSVLRRDVADIVMRTLAENPREEPGTEASEPVKHVHVSISGGNVQVGNSNVMNLVAPPPIEAPAEPAPPDPTGRFANKERRDD